MLIRAVEVVGRGAVLKDIRLAGRSIVSITDHREQDAAGDDRLDFDSAIAFPGLINSHDHLEFDLFPQLGIGPYVDFVAWGHDIHARFKDVIARVQSVPYEQRVKAGIIKNVVAGVTTVVHHGKRTDVPAGTPLGLVREYQYLHSLRLEAWWRLRLNKIDARPVLLHLGEGTNEASRREVESLRRWNLRRRPVIAVHGISADVSQARHLAALVWCPASNFYLYGRTAPVDRLKRHTTIVFGTDSTVSAHWNIWQHLRDARELELLDSSELIDAVTCLPAQVFSLAGHGVLQAGAAADLVIARRKHRDATESFFATDVEDILLVVKDGSIVIYDSILAGQLRPPGGYCEVVVGGVRKHWISELGTWLDELKTLDVELPFRTSIQ